MSTRGLYTFIDNDGQYHVYVHFDNYPEGKYGGVSKIRKALNKAWQLPRFEADEFAAAFVASAKTSEGGVRLTMGENWQQAAPLDIEYHYTVSEKGGKLIVQVDSVSENNGKWIVQLLKKGELKTVSAWAMKLEKSQGFRLATGRLTDRRLSDLRGGQTEEPTPWPTTSTAS